MSADIRLWKKLKKISLVIVGQTRLLRPLR
jgi:hypothetical protein